MRHLKLYLLLVLVCALGSTMALAQGESFSAGPLYDQFDLTLSPGHRIEALGPFYYDQHRETESTWAVPPLFSDTKDPELGLREFNFLYPVMTYDRYGSLYRWQFFQLLSIAGGESLQNTERRRFTLFPLYFQQRSTGPRENYTAVVPFYGQLKHRLFRDDIFFVMFPIYSQTRKRDVINNNYVYPFVNVRHGPGLKGWNVWPFVGHEQKDVTTRTNGFNEVQTVPGHIKWFVLWPIFFNDYTGLGTENVAWQQSLLPLYSVHRSPQRDSTTVIWPFFSHINDREKQYREWDAPWPLVEFANGEGKTTRRVWPFFSRAHSKTIEHDFYAWPIYRYERARLDPLDRQRIRILFFLYSDTIERNTETGKSATRSYLWPLFTRSRDFQGRSRLQVLAPLEPFVQGSHKIGRDWSPLWSVWRAEEDPQTRASSQSLLWNLYRNDTRPDRKKVSILLGLFQYQSEPERTRLRLFYIPLSLGKTRTAQLKSSNGLAQAGPKSGD